jgi:hypothetical protein
MAGIVSGSQRDVTRKERFFLIKEEGAGSPSSKESLYFMAGVLALWLL